ncbi:MAG: hypothetical protein OEZ39_15430 [Gammaproteobacteria bacterium]|nr:hypothetical protein [Gammaproteobacteria bacterium]MDH5653247.1 hypothetical protein [Gammaproteobacteria bacterium]
MSFIQPYLDKLQPYIDGFMHQVSALLNLGAFSTKDLLTGLLFFSLEISLVLIIIIIYMSASHRRKNRKGLQFAKDLKNRIKEYLPARKEKLTAMIADLVPHDEAWARKSAEEAAEFEKAVYKRILNIALHKDLDNCLSITTDMERLTDSYQRILTYLSGEGGGATGGGSETEKVSELKSIVAKQRKEKQKLQDELEETIKVVDGIVKEYSRIFSDAPNKEGVDHIEQALAGLKEKIGVHIKDEDSGNVSVGEDESAPAAAAEPAAETTKDPELEQLREVTGVEVKPDPDKG